MYTRMSVQSLVRVCVCKSNGPGTEFGSPCQPSCLNRSAKPAGFRSLNKSPRLAHGHKESKGGGKGYESGSKPQEHGGLRWRGRRWVEFEAADTSYVGKLQLQRLKLPTAAHGCGLEAVRLSLPHLLSPSHVHAFSA